MTVHICPICAGKGWVADTATPACYTMPPPAADPIGPELDAVFDRLLDVLHAAGNMVAVADATWDWDGRRGDAIGALRLAVQRARETRDKWRGGK